MSQLVVAVFTFGRLLGERERINEVPKLRNNAEQIVIAADYRNILQQTKVYCQPQSQNTKEIMVKSKEERQLLAKSKSFNAVVSLLLTIEKCCVVTYTL